MDTKLKKSDRRLAPRVLAVLLLTVLLVINSLSLAKLARGAVMFGAAALTRSEEPVTQTTAFAAETKALVGYLTFMLAENRAGSDSVSKETSLEQLKDSFAAQLSLYNAIIADCNTCERLEESGFTPRDPVAAEEPAADDGLESTTVPTSVDITAEQGYWYYRFLESDYNSVEDFASEKSGYYEYLTALSELNAYYSVSRNEITDYLGSVTSMKYYAVNKDNGDVLSNIGSCTTAADEQTAAAAVAGNEWYLSRENGNVSSSDTRSYGKEGNYYPYFGIAPASPARGAEISIERESLLPSTSKQWLEEFSDNFNIYLGYDSAAAATGNDGFSIIEKEYKAFSFTSKDAVVAGAIALISVAIIVYLISVTGKNKQGEPRKYLVDRLWNDLHLFISGCLCIGLASIPVMVTQEVPDTVIGNAPLFSGVCAVSFSAVVLVLLEWLTSAVRHARMKTFFRHTFCWKFIALCLKPFVLLYRYMKDMVLVKNIPKWTTFAFGGALAVNLLFALFSTGSDGAFWFFMMVVVDAALLAAFLKAFTSLSKIMKTVEEAKNGNPAAKVDVDKTFSLYREFAKNVNTVNDGIQAAVDSAVRDQKTKTELITNVSHDLKTPLTSIVSYVDLLKRCGIEGEEANKYIDILDEKSQRLKKLVEDLVEASKVSSGAVELHPVKLNLCELAVQAVGENCEALEKDGIETVYNAPDEPVFIMADGQKTSRVIENLFSNVCKYAMPGTRVYVSVNHDNRYGGLTIKNVSKYPLNISAEELKQRFVRGDESRSSEGSGLGLSIAQNLCNLQGGGCDIEIDGDLFKATVYFPLTLN